MSLLFDAFPKERYCPAEDLQRQRPSGIFRLLAALCLIAGFFAALDLATRQTGGGTALVVAYHAKQQGDLR